MCGQLQKGVGLLYWASSDLWGGGIISDNKFPVRHCKWGVGVWGPQNDTNLEGAQGCWVAQTQWLQPLSIPGHLQPPWTGGCYTVVMCFDSVLGPCDGHKDWTWQGCGCEGILSWTCPTPPSNFAPQVASNPCGQVCDTLIQALRSQEVVPSGGACFGGGGDASHHGP